MHTHPLIGKNLCKKKFDLHIDFGIANMVKRVTDGVAKKVVDPTFPLRTPSGVSNVEEEKNSCERIHVFMTCVGRVSDDQRRVLLGKESPSSRRSNNLDER
jgi:hypothetical protein